MMAIVSGFRIPRVILFKGKRIFCWFFINKTDAFSLLLSSDFHDSKQNLIVYKSKDTDFLWC